MCGPLPVAYSVSAFPLGCLMTNETSVGVPAFGAWAGWKSPSANCLAGAACGNRTAPPSSPLPPPQPVATSTTPATATAASRFDQDPIESNNSPVSRARTIVALIVLAVCTGCGETAVAPEPGVDPRVAAREGLLPTAIGRGPEFVPAARTVGPCLAGPVQGRSRAHVELFGRRHAVVIPAGIGVGAPLVRLRSIGSSPRAAARSRGRWIPRA